MGISRETRRGTQYASPGKGSRDMQPAETVWLSEQTIIRMGAEPTQTPLGLLTAQCAQGNHVVFGRVATEKASFRLPFPCSHRFDYLFPQPIEWRTRFFEPQPVSVRTRYEWGLWLSLEQKPLRQPLHLTLLPVRTVDDWQQIREIRYTSAQATSVTDLTLIDQALERTRERHRHVLSMWYLAYVEEQPIGEIGLIFCAAREGIAGRLLDIQLVPSWRGRGYGQELLQAIALEAQRLGMGSLCLRLPPDHELRERFLHAGFEHVATWTRFRGLTNQL